MSTGRSSIVPAEECPIAVDRRSDVARALDDVRRPRNSRAQRGNTRRRNRRPARSCGPRGGKDDAAGNQEPAEQASVQRPQHVCLLEGAKGASLSVSRLRTTAEERGSVELPGNDIVDQLRVAMPERRPACAVGNESGKGAGRELRLELRQISAP
jgi:hypothetical protein